MNNHINEQDVLDLTLASILEYAKQNSFTQGSIQVHVHFHPLANTAAQLHIVATREIPKQSEE